MRRRPVGFDELDYPLLVNTLLTRYSLRALARASGIALSTLGRIRDGYCEPRVRHAGSLLRLFHLGALSPATTDGHARPTMASQVQARPAEQVSPGIL